MKETLTKITEESQAETDIWNYIFGFTSMAVVRCAVDLGIPDVLTNPMSLSQLSSTLGCSTEALYRLMRFLTYRGIFKQLPSTTTTTTIANESFESTVYTQTPLSRLLMKNKPNTLVDVLLLETSQAMLAPWLSLSGRVLKDASSFQAANGDDLWHYAAANPAHSKLIDEALGCMARRTVPAILDHHMEIFKGITNLVDVGGGNGTALGILVKACPWIVKGINFDLPHVVNVALEFDGVEHVGGDMFESVPKADAAFIMQVLHDWNDEECIAVLKNCKDAIRSDTGKVIIVEAVVDEEEVEKYKHVHLYLDMIMMAHTDTGKERTRKEWEYVLKAAGFNTYTIKHFGSFQSVIEAYP